MNQTILDNQQTLRFRRIILWLSIIATVFAILSCFDQFLSSQWVSEGCYAFTLHFYVRGLMESALRVAPYILFVIYLFLFQYKSKAMALIPIMFSVIVIEKITQAVMHCDVFFMSAGVYRRDILNVIVFSLAAISASNGFYKKIFLVMVLSVGLLIECLETIDLFLNCRWEIDTGLALHWCIRTVGVLGRALFCAALLLFVLYNKIPTILTKKKNADIISKS